MKRAQKILFFPVAAIRLILLLLVTALMGAFGWLFYKICGMSHTQQRQILKIWGKSMLLICGVSVRSRTTSSSGRFILMANHRSYLDIFILAAYCPAAFVAKAEVKNWPVMKTASLLTNIIFVKRNELKSMLAAMALIKELVNSGYPVALFPEGTTHKGPLTKPFKKGSFKIAAELCISVIPVALHYDDEEDAWIGDDTFVGHFFRQMGKPVTRAGLTMGQPVEDDDHKALKLEVQESIDDMLQEMASAGTGTTGT